MSPTYSQSPAAGPGPSARSSQSSAPAPASSSSASADPSRLIANNRALSPESLWTHSSSCVRLRTIPEVSSISGELTVPSVCAGSTVGHSVRPGSGSSPVSVSVLVWSPVSLVPGSVVASLLLVASVVDSLLLAASLAGRLDAQASDPRAATRAKPRRTNPIIPASALLLVGLMGPELDRDPPDRPRQLAARADHPRLVDAELQ